MDSLLKRDFLAIINMIWHLLQKSLFIKISSILYIFWPCYDQLSRYACEDVHNFTEPSRNLQTQFFRKESQLSFEISIMK